MYDMHPGIGRKQIQKMGGEVAWSGRWKEMEQGTMEPRDAAQTIFEEALSEIRTIRARLKGCASVADVEVALKGAEESLLSKRQDHLILDLENQDKNAGSYVSNATRFAPAAFAWDRRRRRKQAALGVDDPRDRLQKRHMKSPVTKAAREYLKDRFGIQPPTCDDLPTLRHPACTNGKVYKGLNAKPTIVLPREIRDDPFSTPPNEVAGMEIHKGLLHLSNRGLLPHYIDVGKTIAGGSWIVRTLSAYLHPYEMRFMKEAATSALEDSLFAKGAGNFKLDVLTPVSMPTNIRVPYRPMSTHYLGGRSSEGAGVSDNRSDVPGVKGAREYDDLMDEHSLHEIMIRYGVTVDSTPEFMSFHRTHIRMWPFLADMILQLEGICSQYAVPLAIVDGRSLVEAAMRTLAQGNSCPMEDLLGSIKNIQEVALILKQPGRRFKGVHGKHEAATTIQSHFRGYQTRLGFPRVSRQRMAARTIQDAWRLNRFRHEAVEKMRKAREVRDQKSEFLQTELLGAWSDIHQSPHVVVHIPSLSGRHMASYRSEHQEIMQMARMCDIADANVDVVFVAPTPVGNEVQGYWKKLLEVGGVEDPGNRLKIVHPENSPRLPSHMSLTSKLLSSPRAMDRIRTFVRGRRAYIVPGIMGDEEITLSVTLGIPFLAGHPNVAHAITLKSGARAVFQNSRMNVAPGRCFAPIPDSATDIDRTPLVTGTKFELDATKRLVVSVEGSTDISHRRPRNDGFLIKGLAETILRNPTYKVWHISIDDEIDGRGVAHFKLQDIKGAPDAVARYVEVAHDEMAVDIEEEAFQVAIHKVAAFLTKSLPKKLVIVRKDLYPSYRHFVQAIRALGGVVEAAPDQVTGCPFANVFVEPSGTIRVLSTHEQIFCPAHIPVGNSFPQCSVPHAAMHDAARAIGQVCQGLGVVGHVGMSFLALRDTDGQLKMWATRLSPCSTTSLTAFQLFDFLTVGAFDARAGAYFIPDDDQSEASFEDKVAEMVGKEVEKREESVSDRGSGIGEHAQDANGGGGGLQKDLSGSGKLQRRFYVSIDRLVHPLLQKMQYSSFFHGCRVHGMCFDMQDRIGTAFNVVDGFASGLLGVLCVGLSSFDAFNELCDVLDFVSGQLGEVKTPATFGSGADDHEGESFTQIQSTVKYLAGMLKSTSS